MLAALLVPLKLQGCRVPGLRALCHSAKRERRNRTGNGRNGSNGFGRRLVVWHNLAAFHGLKKLIRPPERQIESLKLECADLPMVCVWNPVITAKSALRRFGLALKASALRSPSNLDLAKWGGGHRSTADHDLLENVPAGCTVDRIVLYRIGSSSRYYLSISSVSQTGEFMQRNEHDVLELKPYCLLNERGTTSCMVDPKFKLIIGCTANVMFVKQSKWLSI